MTKDKSAPGATSIKRILSGLKKGKLDIGEAYRQLKLLSEASVGPFALEEAGYATVDHGRRLRLGLGEVIYGDGKTTKQIIGIAQKLASSKEPVLITRLSDDKMKALVKRFPRGRKNLLSHTFTVNAPKRRNDPKDGAYVCIITAGTSDIPVAEEAADVCAAMGVAFVRLNDIGVSGIHRVMKNIDIIRNASALVVIAGMEGALPSVIGGLVSRPIFAVPTDVGYGANLKGITALLSMLSSCAPGIAVTNINSGFSAAYAACRVVNTLKESAEK